MNAKVTLSLAILLFTLAFIPRILQIASQPVQPDEVHWEVRSKRVLKNFEEGHYFTLTSHLPHPAVPASVSMAAGMAAARKYNEFRGYKGYQIEGYLDDLSGARIGIAFVSSLVSPFLFLCAIYFIGILPALFFALLFALDPHHISLSRQAHMDGLLTVLVPTSILLYARAQAESRLKSLFKFKTLAAIVFGLCIATKPTAGAIVPIFLIGNLIYHLYGRYRGDKSLLPIVSWSDIWAVIVGHGVFTLVYTRLWYHVTTEPYKLNVPSAFRSSVHTVELVLHDHFLITICVFGMMLAFVTYKWKQSLSLIWKTSETTDQIRNMLPREKISFHTTMAVSLILFFGLVIFTVPQIIENLIGFWSWVGGLSKEVHEAYGRKWAPDPWGYWGYYLTRIPSAILIGLFVFVLSLILTRGRILANEVKFTIAFVFTVSAVTVWTLLLSAADKQAYRYAMPVVPLLYLLAVKGYVDLFGAFSRLPLIRHSSFRCRVVVFLVSLAILVFSACTLKSIHPNYQLYYNRISGGIEAAELRNERLPYVGENEGLKFLVDYADREFPDRTLHVAVVGEPLLYRYALRRLYTASSAKHRIRLHPWNKNILGMPVIGLSSIIKQSAFSKFDSARPPFLYRFTFSGVDLLQILSPVFLTAENPAIIYDLSLMQQAVGGKQRVLQNNEPKQLLFADPEKHKKGYMLLGESPTLLPGKYRAVFSLKLPDRGTDHPAERLVTRLDVGSRCQRTISVRELTSIESRQFAVNCAFSTSANPQIGIYWFGNVPVEVTNIEIHLNEIGKN